MLPFLCMIPSRFRSLLLGVFNVSLGSVPLSLN